MTEITYAQISVVVDDEIVQSVNMAVVSKDQDGKIGVHLLDPVLPVMIREGDTLEIKAILKAIRK